MNLFCGEIVEFLGYQSLDSMPDLILNERTYCKVLVTKWSVGVAKVDELVIQ